MVQLVEHPSLPTTFPSSQVSLPMMNPSPQRAFSSVAVIAGAVLFAEEEVVRRLGTETTCPVGARTLLFIRFRRIAWARVRDVLLELCRDETIRLPLTTSETGVRPSTCSALIKKMMQSTSDAATTEYRRKSDGGAIGEKV
jgi:hypothetical protein